MAGGLVEESRLADPDLAGENEHAAPVEPSVGEQRMELLPLPVAAEQHPPILGGSPEAKVTLCDLASAATALPITKEERWQRSNSRRRTWRSWSSSCSAPWTRSARRSTPRSS